MKEYARSAERQTLVVHATYDLTFLRELSVDVLKSFDECGIPYVSKVLPCGHYTTGEAPYKYLDGWYLGSFVWKRVSQNGVAAPMKRRTRPRGKPGREKRKNEAVRGACCERWLRPGDGREQRHVCGRSVHVVLAAQPHAQPGRRWPASGQVGSYARTLCAIGIVMNDMKAAIAPRSWYQLRGAGWR